MPSKIRKKAAAYEPGRWIKTKIKIGRENSAKKKRRKVARAKR